MFRFKLLTGILSFFTLIASLMTGFSFFNACYKCDKTYWFAQLTNNVVHGFLIVIFVVCISIMAREEIPGIMLIFFHFPAAIFYCIVVFEILDFKKHFSETGVQVVAMVFAAFCSIFHLTLGLLYAFRERIDSEY